MSDTTYNKFQHYGTHAERLAFTPAPPAATQPLYIWFETDTGKTFLFHTAWIEMTGVLAAHHLTHETGGSDALTNLDATILTSGILPDARLSNNILKFTGGYPGGTANFLRADGTFSAPSVGATLPDGVKGQSVLTQGVGVPSILTNLMDLLATGARFSLAANDTSRKYIFGFTDPSGAFELARTDAVAKFRITPDATTPSIIIGTDQSGASQFSIRENGGTIILTPSNGGGAGQIQLGRRLSDSNPAVGARVECWPITGQVPPALAVMNPGGSGTVWAVLPNGTEVFGATPVSATVPAIRSTGAGLEAVLSDGSARTAFHGVFDASEVTVGTLPDARLSSKIARRQITVVIDGGGSPITTGYKTWVSVPVAGTIKKWRILANAAGSIVIDVWKDVFANYPPTVADTITASAKPTLSGTASAESTTLTGWNTTVNAGDVFGFNVDSVATVTKVSLSLEFE